MKLIVVIRVLTGIASLSQAAQDLKSGDNVERVRLPLHDAATVTVVIVPPPTAPHSVPPIPGRSRHWLNVGTISGALVLIGLSHNNDGDGLCNF
jgi:hypothetical protein